MAMQTHGKRSQSLPPRAYAVVACLREVARNGPLPVRGISRGLRSYRCVTSFAARRAVRAGAAPLPVVDLRHPHRERNRRRIPRSRIALHVRQQHGPVPVDSVGSVPRFPRWPRRIGRRRPEHRVGHRVVEEDLSRCSLHVRMDSSGIAMPDVDQRSWPRKEPRATPVSGPAPPSGRRGRKSRGPSSFSPANDPSCRWDGGPGNQVPGNAFAGVTLRAWRAATRSIS